MNIAKTLPKAWEEIQKLFSNKLEKGAYTGTAKDLETLINTKEQNLNSVLTAEISKKEPAFTKNTAFNKSFGTNSNQILEGVKLAETLGIPYGGPLNNSNTKTAGYAYYDSTTKKTYKCTVTNTLNYADASKFEAISNADLLGKFENFTTFGIKYSKAKNIKSGYIATENGWIVARMNTNGSGRVNIDGFEVLKAGDSGSYYHQDTGIAPIEKGQKVTASAVSSLIFIPVN